MTKTWRPGKEEWERIKTAAHNRILKERGLPLSDDDYIEVGADAMLEVLEMIEKRAIAMLEAIERSVTISVKPGLCLFPKCRNFAKNHGYCREHYERLNKVA